MILTLGLAALAAVVHVAFFVLESFLFTKPAGRKVFGTTAADAETMKFLAYNQGFYNLFLAVGCAVGIGLVVSGRSEAGRAMIAFACATMVGAAAVLGSGGRKYARGVVVQGGPALAALLAVLSG
jgi:putative membrane protein